MSPAETQADVPVSHVNDAILSLFSLATYRRFGLDVRFTANPRGWSKPPAPALMATASKAPALL